MSEGLNGLVVLEIADTPGAAFAVSLLADAGAEAIICEPPEGSRLRTLGFGALDSTRWQILARNKRSIALDWSHPENGETLRALLHRADLLVTDLAPQDQAGHPWFAAYRALPEDSRPLMVELFPTGADRPDLWHWGILPEFASAASGVIALTGHTGKTPLLAEAPLADYLAGTLAAARALMALRTAYLTGRRSGPIETPLHQALHRMIEWQVPVATAFGRAETRMGNNFPMNAGIANMHPTGDGGYVAISAVTQATAVRLMTMVGGPELANDPRFATAEARAQGLETLYARIDAWTSARSTPEILKIAAEQDVVLGPIFTTAEIFADEQVRARGNIVEVPVDGGGTVLMPSIAPTVEGWSRSIRRVGPTIGQDTNEILYELTRHPHESRDRTSDGRASRNMGPGVRRDDRTEAGRKLLVLELGAVIAGPFAGSMMAELGGTVIKIESPDAGDSLRKMGPAKNGVQLWFGTSARDKKCVTLNLKHPDGKAIFLQLVRMADVLVENFRPGVLTRLGLDWPALHEVNPQLVMLSISGFGQTGPQAGRPGFGKIAEGLSGIVTLTGEAGKAPLYVGFSLADAGAGLFGVEAVAAALYRRDVLGGHGTRIDLALYEPLMRMIDCQFALHGQGHAPVRGGTNDPYGFGASSPDRPRFHMAETREGRWFMLALPPGVAAGAGPAWDGLSEAELLAKAAENRIPLCPVMDGQSLANEPYYAARHDIIRGEIDGVGPLAAPGPIAGGPTRLFHPPAMGAANAEIYGGLLGLSDGDLARLRAEGVI